MKVTKNIRLSPELPYLNQIHPSPKNSSVPPHCRSEVFQLGQPVVSHGPFNELSPLFRNYKAWQTASGTAVPCSPQLRHFGLLSAQLPASAGAVSRGLDFSLNQPLFTNVSPHPSGAVSHTPPKALHSCSRLASARGSFSRPGTMVSSEVLSRQSSPAHWGRQTDTKQRKQEAAYTCCQMAVRNVEETIG